MTLDQVSDILLEETDATHMRVSQGNNSAEDATYEFGCVLLISLAWKLVLRNVAYVGQSYPARSSNA